MTIKELRKYRENLEKIECIDRQIEKKRQYVCDVVEGSRNAPSYEKTPQIVDGYIHGSGAVSLQTEKKRLEAENLQIERFIDSIPKTRAYTALRIYCIDENYNNPTWEEVAKAMGEASGEALNKYVEKYLKK